MQRLTHYICLQHSTDVIKHEPASDSESDTQLISMKQEGLTAFSAVKNESEVSFPVTNHVIACEHVLFYVKNKAGQ